MVREQLAARSVRDRRVLDAFRKVLRHKFVQPDDIRHAYEDHPLPIGEGQTISQPYMVALMTECLKLRGTEKVLEIGTGSGYQTAILAELAGSVYTVERLASLQERARSVLGALGYTKVFFKLGDGTQGWEEEAPFARIVVTAGAPRIPRRLLDQLAPAGILVIPVGGGAVQTLKRITRRGDNFDEEEICSCTFVKLIGEDGWRTGEA